MMVQLEILVELVLELASAMELQLEILILELVLELALELALEIHQMIGKYRCVPNPSTNILTLRHMRIASQCCYMRHTHSPLARYILLLYTQIPQNTHCKRKSYMA